jgi:hypothetical protein
MRSSLPPIRAIDEDPDEYVAFLEELAHAAELLLVGGLARDRMALVIIDSLAERLLYQHAQRSFQAGDARVAILTDPFPASRRREILDDFRKRVNLALTDEKVFIFVDPILDELDAEIFRVAHAYRGAGYHRGEHNPALAGALGRLYAQAVGRAFTRSTNHSFSTLPSKAIVELKRLHAGIDTEPFGEAYTRSATGPIIEAITDPLSVDVKALAEQLRADSEWRLGAIDDIIKGLQRDLDDEQIGDLIEAAQHWAQHRGDQELHELAREAQILANQARDQDELDDELRKQILDNKRAQAARMDWLKTETEIRVDPGTIEMLRRRAGRLTGKAEVTSLLHAYRELDELLRLLERAVQWVERSWDQTIQQAIDEARGK